MAVTAAAVALGLAGVEKAFRNVTGEFRRRRLHARVTGSEAPRLGLFAQPLLYHKRGGLNFKGHLARPMWNFHTAKLY